MTVCGAWYSQRISTTALSDLFSLFCLIALVGVLGRHDDYVTSTESLSKLGMQWTAGRSGMQCTSTLFSKY